MLTDDYLQKLHSRMYGEVWAWAGTYRQRQINLGVEPHRIRIELRHLFGDARAWLAHNTYPPREIAIRLHHRVALIHPFSNGNGRHARTLADMVLIRHFKAAPLSWGGGIASQGGAREAYLDAMRAADRHDIRPLLAFAASGQT